MKLLIQEIDPKVNISSLEGNIFDLGNDEGTRSLLSEIISSVPGIDEAMSFGQLIG
jgi:arsenite-transporting ATPase